MLHACRLCGSFHGYSRIRLASLLLQCSRACTVKYLFTVICTFSYDNCTVVMVTCAGTLVMVQHPGRVKAQMEAVLHNTIVF